MNDSEWFRCFLYSSWRILDPENSSGCCSLRLAPHTQGLAGHWRLLDGGGIKVLQTQALETRGTQRCEWQNLRVWLGLLAVHILRDLFDDRLCYVVLTPFMRSCVYVYNYIMENVWEYQPNLVKLKEIIQKLLGVAQWSFLRSLAIAGGTCFN